MEDVKKYLKFYHNLIVVEFNGKMYSMSSTVMLGWNDRCTLRLRPINTLTDNEIKALEDKYRIIFDQDWVEALYQYSSIIANLIHMRFDVFQLIDKGLAKELIYDNTRKEYGCTA